MAHSQELHELRRLVLSYAALEGVNAVLQAARLAIQNYGKLCMA